MDITAALARLGGAARWDELVGRGVTEWALSRARADGRVVSPVRGTYALPGADAAQVAAAALRGQITCVSACAHWRIRQLEPPQGVHIAVPDNRHVADHRLASLGLPGIHRGLPWSEGERVASLEQALDASALCTTPLQQLVMVDAALEARLVNRDAVSDFRCGTARRRRWLSHTANGGAMSVSESVARATLVAAGFQPGVQVPREGVGALDLAVGKRHFVEVDGFEEHSKWTQFSKDRRRDREVSAARDWTLRYTYWDVVEDPRWFARDVSRIIRVPVSPRFEARIVWLTALPSTALNRI